ncbi:hypothetical protein N581_06495 [Lactobacillus jensenii MD IIE-70(2)]|nr:hypothetical protein N581_06495 [Lactobacillus jensenii MD IIE-70(2)]
MDGKQDFFNYALSIVPILILLLVTKYILFDSKVNKLPLYNLIAVCIILFFGSFMSEPITLTILIDTLVLIFVANFLKKSVVKDFFYFFFFFSIRNYCYVCK